MNRYIGVDVAYGKPMVLAVVNPDKLPNVDVITLDTTKSREIRDRIENVTKQLREIDYDFSDSSVFVEEMFFRNNAKVLSSLSMMVGALFQVFRDFNCTFNTVLASEWRLKIFGAGDVDKQTAIDYVENNYTINHINRSPRKKHIDDDVAESILLSIYGMQFGNNN